MTNKQNTNKNVVNQPAPFVNEQIIGVPGELYPLTGHIVVPIVVTPEQFNQFWKRYQEDEALEKKRARSAFTNHAVLSTYWTRLPLVLSSNLAVDGQPVGLPDEPTELIDQAIAPFVVAATQECVQRATRLPLLGSASKKGTGA